MSTNHSASPNGGSEFWKGIQYLYFMRFSILLWAFLALLPALDLAGVTTSITHGMFALEVKQGLIFARPTSTQYNLGQFIWIGFYVVLCGLIAHLSARIICAYGEERFRVSPPKWFRVASMEGDADATEKGMSWAAFIIAQTPGLWFLGYAAFVSVHETSPAAPLQFWKPVLGFAVGVIFALLAWLLTAFFYAFLRHPGTTRFYFFFLPRNKWKLLQTVLRVPPNRSRLAGWIDEKLQSFHKLGPGFERPDEKGAVHSGIALAVILFVLLLLIYGLVGLLTVPESWRALWKASRVIFVLWSALVSILPILFIVLLCGEALGLGANGGNVGSASDTKTARRSGAAAVVVFLTASLLFAALVWGSFPVLVTILILALSTCWLFSGTAFILDKFRIPVVTITFLLFALGWWWVKSLDHFYPTFAGAYVPPPTTVEAVEKFKERHGADPMIVVTASGGGIHSAAWTATVLAGLEKAFHDNGKSFHQHVLLMSSVSGGSVATSYWAEDYLNEARGRGFDAERIVDYSECSSLESVAWGVLFTDVNHLLIWRDWAARMFSGLRTYDRGWALETSFERNRNPGCQWATNEVPRPQRYKLTDLRDTLKDKGTGVPAFAFNSVLVKNGQRFLISNYSVPPFSDAYCDAALGISSPACPPNPHPAPNFLDACHGLDISLFTAARLSATFPYVSPVAAAELPKEFTDGQKQTDHFCAEQHIADGGYYDNDGMDSAMEFLWSAFGYQESTLREANTETPSQAPSEDEEQTNNEGTCPHLGQRPCIILLEIRNSMEPESGLPSAPSPPILGHVVEQAFAPVKTVLGAWGVAQPLRNQQEFRFLQFALKERVDFDHVVFSFKQVAPVCSSQGSGLEEEKDPLSWHLTPRAIDKIRCEWDNLYKSDARALADSFPATQ